MQRDRELTVALRRAGPRDREFLVDVHVRALGPVALVGYGWPAFRLERQFEREVDIANCYLIVVDGTDAGYISVQHRGAFWYIDAIAVAPKYQKKGVGTAALKTVLEDAGHLPVRLNVLHVNRAKVLYERLGFRVIQRDDRRQIMEWRAVAV